MSYVNAHYIKKKEKTPEKHIKRFLWKYHSAEKVFLVIMRQFSTFPSFEIILNFRNVTVQVEEKMKCEKEIHNLQKENSLH